MFTPDRIATDELLDDPSAPRAEVERSLRDLRRINRYLGGIGVYRSLVRRIQPASIVDLGTGTSDLLEAVPHVALRVGLDFKIDHLLYLRDGSGVHRVVADARRLPFRTGAVDLVTSSHFFHHFSPEENVGVLDESLRIARHVAVTDTQRHHVPLFFIRLLGALRMIGRITRLDGPASVLQGYTVEEVQAIAARVRASKQDIMKKWPYRWAILLSK